MPRPARALCWLIAPLMAGLTLGGCTLQPAASPSATATPAATSTQAPSPTQSPSPVQSASPSPTATAAQPSVVRPSTGPSSPAATAPPITLASPPAGGQITVTEGDAGKTYQLHVGGLITLALHATQGFTPWEVQPPDQKVLASVVNPAAAAVQGTTLRSFRAVGTGQTDISASSRPVCNPGQPCPQLIQGFRITVVVS